MTVYPSRWSRLVTRFQLEASAHAPCTSTMVGFGPDGLPAAVCAAAPVVNSALRPTAAAATRNASHRGGSALSALMDTRVLLSAFTVVAEVRVLCGRYFPVRQGPPEPRGTMDLDRNHPPHDEAPLSSYATQFNLAAGNGLVIRPLRPRGRDLRELSAFPSWRAAAVLNVRELAGLWHLPQAGAVVPHLERTGARRR